MKVREIEKSRWRIGIPVAAFTHINTSMRAWIDLFESPIQYYIRFGEIPENERSGIGRSPTWVHHLYRTSDEEEGVSVYMARWMPSTEQWTIEDCGNYSTLDHLIHEASEGTRQIYIVTGDEQPEPGIDGEPLLRNVKIIKTITVPYLLVPGFFDGQEVSKQNRFSSSEMILLYPDGTSKKETNVQITDSEINDLLGWSASYNGIDGQYQGDKWTLFRTVDTEGKPTNSNATILLGSMMNQDISDLPLRGLAIMLKSPTKTIVHV